MNRLDLQALSDARVREAKTLLDAGAYPGSYYLMGYGVECAIKAAIAKQVQQHEFPNKQLAQDAYSHNLMGLMKTAGLWPTFQAAMRANTNLADYWAVVKDWDEQSRYTLAIAEAQARDLHLACTARVHGVLTWLKNYW